MNTDDRKSSFFVKSAFFRFFTPAMLSSFGLALSGIVDSVIVGRMIGEPGLAAIGFMLPIFMVFNTFDQAFSIGGSQLYVTRISEGKPKEAIRIFNSVLVFSFLLSLLLAILGWIFCDPILRLLGVPFTDGEVLACSRAYARVLLGSAPVFFLRYVLYYFVQKDDDPTLAMIALLSGNLIDFVLTFVFVIGMKMGVAGAIWSTVIGYSVSCLVCLLHFFRKWNILRFVPAIPNMGDVAGSLRIGMATASQYAYQFVTAILINNIVVAIGGSSGIAILNVMLNFSYLISSFSDGTCSAIQPMVGTYYAEHAGDDVKQTLRYALLFGFGLILIFSLAACVFSQQICRFFGLVDPESVSTGTMAIRIYCCASLFAFFNILACGYYQSIGVVKIAYMINLGRTLIFTVVFALLFSRLGIHWFWLTWIAQEFLTLGIWLIYSWRKHDILHLPQDSGNVLHLVLDSSDSDISKMIETTADFCDEHNANPAQSYFASNAAEEICTAIIQNAFTGNVNEYIQVTMIAEDSGDFILHIRDSAVHFNPFNMKTQEIGLEDDSGLDALGVLLVKKKAKEFNYRQYYGFNTTFIRV